MPTHSPLRQQVTPGALLIVSVILVALQVANVVWWRQAFDLGHSQEERVAIYLAALPAFLAHRGPLGGTLFFAMCGILGAVCGVPAAFLGRWPFAILGWVTVAANGLFVLWYLFTLM
jgi:hypothetical protein